MGVHTWLPAATPGPAPTVCRGPPVVASHGLPLVTVLQPLPLGLHSTGPSSQYMLEAPLTSHVTDTQQ
jgi:hypothetical protein